MNIAPIHVRSMRPLAPSLVVLPALALALAGCPSPMEPPPPEEPMIAAPEAPRIPWLAAGTPDVQAPRIPWLTDESACPEGWGWTEVAPGLNGCDPYPTGHIEDCGPTGAHFPGEAGCRDLDSGDTEWPSDLPTTNVLYVREGASSGDGTRALPFATLPEALAAAVEGTTIALAPGRYDTGQGPEVAAAPGTFDTLSHLNQPGVRLRGTSVANTTLYSNRPTVPEGSPGDTAMLVVEAEGVEITDLRFDSAHPAVDIRSGGDATVRRVVLDGTLSGLAASAGGVGVFEDVLAAGWTRLPVVLALGGSITLRRAVLRDDGMANTIGSEGTRSSVSVEDVAVLDANSAFIAANGGEVDATRVAVVAPRSALVAGGTGARIHGRWLHLDRIPPTATGVFVREGGAIELEDLVAPGVSGSPGEVSILGSRAGSTLSVSRGVLAGTRPGLVVEGTVLLSDVISVGANNHVEARGATADVTLNRVELSGGPAYGIYAESSARVSAFNLSIHDVTPYSAIYAWGASVQIERAVLERGQSGLYAYGGAEATLTDVVIRDMTESDATWTIAGLVASGATVTATRVLVERVAGVSATAFDPGASLHFEDVSLREFRGAPGNSRGIGLYRDGAPSSVRRVEISDGNGVGMNTSSDAHIEDLFIHDIEPDTDGTYGEGLFVGARPDLAPPAQVTGARISIRDVALVGLVVNAVSEGSPARASVTLGDVRIEGIGTPAAGGPGVFARGPADLSLTRFVVREAVSVGVMSTMGARVTLADGLEIGRAHV
jgi:hypothetical protein